MRILLSVAGIRGFLLPDQQRRTLDEFTAELDLGQGEARWKQTAVWTMLVLSGVIASAGPGIAKTRGEPLAAVRRHRGERRRADGDALLSAASSSAH